MIISARRDVKSLPARKFARPLPENFGGAGLA